MQDVAGNSGIEASVAADGPKSSELESFTVDSFKITISGEKVELPRNIITLIRERLEYGPHLLMGNEIYFEHNGNIYTRNGQIVVEEKKDY